MAFTGSYICNSYGLGLFKGEQDLTTDTLKLALYDNTATLTNATTVYTATGELAAALGYATGGATVAGASAALSGNYPIFTCSNVVWNPATFTARGALLYNVTKANKAIMILDFGADKLASGTFTVNIPTPDINNGLIVITLTVL